MTTRSRTHTRNKRSWSRTPTENSRAMELEPNERDTLTRAREELRKLFKRPPRSVAANPHRAQHQERRHS